MLTLRSLFVRRGRILVSMAQRIDIVDIYSGDDPVDFHAIAAAGAVGVILKATQGSTYNDPNFAEYRSRALTVFDAGCVHSYHFLDDTDAETQMAHYVSVTQGMPGRWLDYEENPDGDTCTLATAVAACHILQGKQGSFPGMYGSDADLLGAALDAGHFTVCPLWIARYRPEPPDHACQLWQFSEGVAGDPTISGKLYDLDSYLNGDSAACQAWLRSLAQ